MTRRTFLISGAGSGIGKAIALAFAARKDRVLLLGRTEDRLLETRDLLAGDDHQVLVADQRDKNQLREALKEIDTLDGAIANAGIGGENQYDDSDRWDDIVNTNLTGTYFFAKEALNKMNKKDGFKHLLFISSILARLGVPGYSAYCASKAGLLGLMRSLAAEHAGDQILVNAICPGWVNTQMARDGIQGFADLTGKTYEDAHREQMSYVPLGKMSHPEEIAEFMVYLTELSQTSITGQTFDINNGALMPC